MNSNSDAAKELTAHANGLSAILDEFNSSPNASTLEKQIDPLRK